MKKRWVVEFRDMGYFDGFEANSWTQLYWTKIGAIVSAWWTRNMFSYQGQTRVYKKVNG